MSISFAATPQSKEAQQARTYTDPSRGAPPSRRSGANAPYIDKDHWNKVFTEPEYFDSIAKQKGMAEGAKVSLFGDDYVYRQAMIGYMSATRGVPLDDMRKVFDVEKDAFAQKNLGKKTASAREMFDWHKAKFERDNEKQAAARQILNNVAQRAMTDFATGGDTPFVETVAKDIDAAGDMFTDEEKSRLWQMAEENDIKLRATQMRFAPEAKFIFDALRQTTGEGAGFGAPDMREMATRFAKLPDNQRKAIYELAGSFAQLNQTDKGFWYQMAESLGRGASDIVERVPRNIKEQALRNDLRLLEGDQPVFAGTGVQGTAYSAFGTTPLTPEEREQAAEKVRGELGIFKVERELRDLAERVIDPIKTVTVLPEIVEEGLYGAARSIPYTAVAAVPYAGAPAVAGALYSSNYDRIMLEYPDIDPDKAALIAAISAPIEAGLERMKVNTIMGRLPFFGGLVKRFQHPNQRNITRIAIGGAGVLAEQNAQEILQNATFPFVQMIGSVLDKDIPEYNLDLASMPRDLAVQFVALLPLSLIGVTALSYREIKRGDAALRDKAAMIDLGLSEDAADRVLGATSVEEAQTIFREEYAKRDPKAVEAAAQRIVDKAVALREQANPAVLPRLEKQGADYVVLSPEGKELARSTDQTAAEQALVSARRETVQREMRDVHTGINEAVEFIKKVSEARQRGEDVAKFIRDNSPRTLLTDYEANPTQENLDRLFETVRFFGQDINEPAELANFPVTGSNQGELREGIWRSIIRINDGADATIVMREFAQDNLKRAIAEGRVTMDFVRQQLNDILPQIDSDRMERRLRTETDTDVIEAFSDIAVAYFRGSIREEQIPAGLRGIMRRLAIMTRDIFRRAYNLARLRAEGKLDRDFEALLAEAVGVDQQALVDRARERTEQEVGAAPEVANYSIAVSQLELNLRKEKLPKVLVRTAALTIGDYRLEIFTTDGQYVGYADLGYDDGDDSITIDQTFVELKYRGKGYGEALYREIAKFAQARDVTILFASSISREAIAVREKLFETDYKTVKGQDDDGEQIEMASLVDPTANYSIGLRPDFISQVSDRDDASRVGTAKLGTDKVPVDTPQTSNISGDMVPEDLLAKQMAKVDYAHLPDSIRNEADPKKKRRKLINWFKKNLLALHDAFPEEFRARATHWYDGANRIAREFGQRFNSTVEQASGVIAVFSPQKDWFMNVAQAMQFMELWTTSQDVVLSEETVRAEVEDIIEAATAPQRQKRKKAPNETKEQAAERKAYNQQLDQKAKDERRKTLDQIIGKTIRELDDQPYLQGWAIRVLAQVTFGRNYRNISPEGDMLGMATNDDGALAKNGWGSINEIEKAVRIMKDGSLANISDNLGNEHKVRNFYNNIVAPNSGFGDATIDTHAVAAAHLMPYGAKATEVQHNFGSGMNSSDAMGVSGLYHVYLDAYREAAKERGLQPRQLQSITWEAIRLVYPAANKNAATLAKAAQTWNSLSDGRARNSLVGGTIPSPVWAGTGHVAESQSLAGATEGDGQGSDSGRGLRSGDRSDGRRGVGNYSILARYEGMPSVVVEGGRPYSPIVRDLLKRRAAGEDIPREVIDQAINENFPAQLVEVPRSVAELPDRATIDDAIDKGQRDKRIDVSTIEAGEKVAIRQDVPAMTRKGVGVVTVKSKAGNSYEAAVRITEPEFVLNEKKSLRIAMGEAKGPHIVINGKWAADQSMPDDLETWTQVGYNPDRHSFYYDRATMQQVTGGSEAYQIGNTVFVKDAQYGDGQISDISYSISTQSEIDRVQAAMGALDRSPLDTLEITEKLRKRFASIMAENMVELAAMRQGGVAEREVLDEEGNPIGPQPTGATTKATGAEIRRTKLLQALGELDGLLSALPPQVAAKVGGYTVLANIGTGDRALSNFFIKRLEMIDKELERYLKDRYTKALDQLFERAKPRQDAAGKVPQGKLGASVHALFDELKLATKKTVVEVDGEVTSLEQQVASGELEPDMEAMKGLLADVLPLFANWATADASRMAQAVQIGFDILRKAYKRQRELTQIKRNQQEERRLVARESTGITGDIDEAINKQQNIAGKRWQQWKALNVNLFGFDQLISFVFGRDSKITKEIVNAQRKADNVKADELIGVWEEWQGVLAELAGIEDSRSMKATHRGQDIVYRLAEPKTAKIKHTNMQGEQIELEFSQNQLITITMMWMQPKGRAHMMGKLDSDGNPIGDWHYDQDFVNRVEAKMTPEARAIRRFLLRKYAEEWSSINEVFVRLRGINMPQEDFYSPLGVDPVVAIDSGLLADPSTGFALSAPNRTPPALRSRGAAVAKPKFQDAVQVYFAHRKQMAHWKAYAEFNSDMLSVLGHRNTRNAVEAKGGVEALKTLNKWLTYMTQGGNIDAAAGLAMNEYFNGVMGRIASFILFGKVVTIAIQSTQLGAAAAKMPFPSYIKRLAKLLTGQMSWGASLRSPYIQRRIKEMPPQVQLAMEGLLANKPSYIAEAARRVGWYISGSDGLYTAGTYAMIYDYRLEQAKKAGLSGPEAERVAREEAERDTDEVAQPTRMGARSAFEATMTSPLARSAWAFGSDARKNWAMNSFLWFSNASADRKRQALYFTAVISTAMATVIRTIARDIKDDEDDELFDEKNWDVRRMVLMMATDFVYGFPVLGEMAEETAFRLFGEYRPQGSVLSVGDAPAALSRMPQHIADTLNGEADTDKIVKDVNRMLQGMGLFAPQAASAAALSNAAKDLYEFTKPLWKDDE